MKLSPLDITAGLIARVAYFVIGLFFLPMAWLVFFSTTGLAVSPLAVPLTYNGVLFGLPLIVAACIGCGVLFMLFGPGFVRRRRERGTGQLAVLRATSRFRYEDDSGDAGDAPHIPTAKPRQGAPNAVRQEHR